MPAPKSKNYNIIQAHVIAEFAGGVKAAVIAQEFGCGRHRADVTLTRERRRHGVPGAPAGTVLTLIRERMRRNPEFFGLPPLEPNTPEYFFMRERGPISLRGALLHPQPED